MTDISSELKRMYQEDQKDRTDGLFETNPKLIEERDKARLGYVLDQAEGKTLKTPADYLYAAMILQHGIETKHYEMAYEFATKAAKEGFVRESGEVDPLWLSAAAKDRFLMSQGKPQLYGTQFRRDTKGGLLYLYKVDPNVTDEERAKLHVPPISEAYKKVETRNKDI